MNYIGNLTKEEKSTICEIITGEGFKRLFIKNEQKFSKIQKGFRAKSLTESFALSIAITHIDKLFIANWVNRLVEKYLKIIERNIAELESKGCSHNTALATTILDSLFVNHVELYLKLSGLSLDANARSQLFSEIIALNLKRAKNDEASTQLRTLEEENQYLLEQVEENKHSIATIQTDCEEKVQKLEREKNHLESSLAETKAKISALQTNYTVFAANDTDYLSLFDDTDTSVLPPYGMDEIVSLCGVISYYDEDNHEQKRLKRYADLGNDGQYHIFQIDKDSPIQSTNRTRLFFRDGPTKEGFCGIWTWSVIPNEKDSSKDYIKSQYNTKINPIEIVTLTHIENIDDLVTCLKHGISYRCHSRKVMFAYHNLKGQYTGVLCTEKEINEVDGKTTISEECNAVPVYQFSDADIIFLNNGLSFYRYAFAGLPSKLCRVKSPLNIVKDIVLSSISWGTFKGKDVTRSQHKAFRDFIDSIPIDDITRKISTACRCSIPTAKVLLDEFLSKVWKYVDGNSLEDEILLSAILNNAKLKERTQEISRKAWEIENEKLLFEAQQKLDLLNKELESTKDNLEKAQESLRQAKAEDERLSATIAKNKKLAEDVEKAVAARIQKANESAAEFITNLAFQPIQVPSSAFSANISASDTSTYCTFPASKDRDNLTQNRSWTEVITTAEYELEDAGVSASCKTGLAVFLCAAYNKKQPILLVGPNAIDIAKAFSASIVAHEHGVLYCEGNYNHQTVEKIGAHGEKIVIINNLIGSGWMNRLPEILSKKDTFYIAIHPYAEDVQVEPKSLYNFLLPVFTEFFVDKKASGDYHGGYSSKDFNPDTDLHIKDQKLSVLKRLPMSSLIRNNIQSLVNTMHHLCPEAGPDGDFLFTILPIYYASMSMDKLQAVMADQNRFQISSDLKRNLQHVLGENDE